MSDSDANKAVVIRFHDEVINGLNFDLVPQLMHEEMEHARGAIGYTLTQMDPSGVAELRKFSGYRRFIEATKLLRRNFPEWHSEMLLCIAEGDYVLTKCVVTGRDRGGFMGTGPASGAKFKLEQLVLQKVIDGRIKQVYALSDELSFWRALGASLPGTDASFPGKG